MKTIRIAAVALLILAAAALAGIGRPESAGGADRELREGITVTGLGTVKVVPDEAQFSFGLETQGATAKDALARNSAGMERILAALRRAGVDESDIRTQDVSVWPRYEVESNPSEGYTARNMISVTIRDLGKAGAIIDAASRAGANEVNGPYLSSSDREELQKKALVAAVRNAREKAGTLAEAAGVRLGGVTAIVEGSDYGGPMPYAVEGRLSAAAAKPVPIEPGQEEIQATVTVTYAID